MHSYKSKNTDTYVRCYEKHQPLPLVDDLVVYGGSGAYPIVKDASIYVGLDVGSVVNEKAYPWNDNHCFKFLITDMGVPANVLEFKNMITWLDTMIRAGHKTHVGCIGGHGRTGLVFAALVSHMGITKDAITYVRTNYCKKAVESEKQVEWLHKHFGVKKVEPTKGTQDFSWYKSTSKKKPKGTPKVTRVHCVDCSSNIWG